MRMIKKEKEVFMRKTYVKHTVEVESIMVEDVILQSVAIEDSVFGFDDYDEVF